MPHEICVRLFFKAKRERAAASRRSRPNCLGTRHTTQDPPGVCKT